MKRFFFRKAAAICLVMALFLSLAGCGVKDTSTKDGKTEVVLNEVAHSIFYAPMYVAIEEGYFEEKGISLTLVTVSWEVRVRFILMWEERKIMWSILHS